MLLQNWCFSILLFRNREPEITVWNHRALWLSQQPQFEVFLLSFRTEAINILPELLCDHECWTDLWSGTDGFHSQVLLLGVSKALSVPSPLVSIRTMNRNFTELIGSVGGTRQKKSAFLAEWWWCTLLIPGLSKQRQANLQLHDCQGYTQKSCLKKKKKTKIKLWEQEISC